MLLAKRMEHCMYIKFSNTTAFSQFQRRRVKETIFEVEQIDELRNKQTSKQNMKQNVKASSNSNQISSLNYSTTRSNPKMWCGKTQVSLGWRQMMLKVNLINLIRTLSQDLFCTPIRVVKGLLAHKAHHPSQKWKLSALRSVNCWQ